MLITVSFSQNEKMCEYYKSKKGCPPQKIAGSRILISSDSTAI